MSILEVRQVLEKHLDLMSPPLATAWENQDFSPVPGTPFQAVTLLPAEPDNPEAGGFYREQGLLQVTLCYPLQGGPAAALARAEAIRAAFKRGTSLTKNGVTTVVERTPEIGPGSPDQDRYQVPVRIRWYANVASS
jgi:hypothetical protein